MHNNLQQNPSSEILWNLTQNIQKLIAEPEIHCYFDILLYSDTSEQENNIENIWPSNWYWKPKYLEVVVENVEQEEVKHKVS